MFLKTQKIGFLKYKLLIFKVILFCMVFTDDFIFNINILYQKEANFYLSSS
jgi:hypothetical protein